MNHFFFFFFFLSISFFFFLPILIFCQDDYRYTNCSQDFHCGPVKDIDYPFWGGVRPEYCGHPSFKLQCQDNIPIIYILYQKYQILSINQDNQTFQIARTDSWNGDCPVQPINGDTTFDYSLFNYSDSKVANLTMFYACPSLPSTIPNLFSCPINDTTSDAWISTWPDPTRIYPELRECKLIVVVPISGTPVTSSDRPDRPVEEIVKQGFELKYLVDGLVCDECEKSGGQCGYNRTTVELTCFCRRGPNQRSCIKKEMASNSNSVPTMHGNHGKKPEKFTGTDFKLWQ